jgi:hypothetical protein
LTIPPREASTSTGADTAAAAAARHHHHPNILFDYSSSSVVVGESLVDSHCHFHLLLPRSDDRAYDKDHVRNFVKVNQN